MLSTPSRRGWPPGAHYSYVCRLFVKAYGLYGRAFIWLCQLVIFSSYWVQATEAFVLAFPLSPKNSPQGSGLEVRWQVLPRG